MKSLRIVADLVQSRPQEELDARTASNHRRQATAAIAIALIVLLLVAGLTTPSFLTFENILVVIRNASVTGIVALGMSYVTISGNLFALSAEELSILSACTFGWLMRANFGLSLSLAITLLFSGRRLRQLESANLLLRVKLRARERPKRTGTGGAGPVLVVPPGGSSRSTNNPVGRVANGGR